MPAVDPNPAIADLLAAVDRFRNAIDAGPDREAASSPFAVVSRGYEADANAERVAARRLGYVAFVLLAVGVALATVGVVDASEAREFHFDRFAAYGSVAVVIVAAAAAAFHEAVGRRRSELDARRLQRQFQALEPYLAELPAPLRELLRGTLAASLFAPLASEEPWRQPRWPEPAAMLEALRARASPEGVAGEATTCSDDD